ncbi:MAG: phytoene/squalene synthase family protein [Proteobacteria bacterium]|nr:MAG: phytoene/squalene synthase family protein [Pseudomonadota bacterium]
MRDGYCENLVRAADRDRFLSTLFAPGEHRAALFALYAFNIEITRVREVAHGPLAGEIRLQWWRDVIGGEGRGEISAHPVASALLAAIARYRLPSELLTALVDARQFDLYDEPMATLAALERYAEDVASGLIALAARVLAAGEEAPIAAIAREAGLAHALTGLLQAFAAHTARGQLYVPMEVLQRHGVDRNDVQSLRPSAALRAALAELRAQARRHLAAAQQAFATTPSAFVPALLPVAMVGPTLARMERGDAFAPIEFAPWRRQWVIWRAARRPARIFAA